VVAFLLGGVLRTVFSSWIYALTCCGCLTFHIRSSCLTVRVFRFVLCISAYYLSPARLDSSSACCGKGLRQATFPDYTTHHRWTCLPPHCCSVPICISAMPATPWNACACHRSTAAAALTVPSALPARPTRCCLRGLHLYAFCRITTGRTDAQDWAFLPRAAPPPAATLLRYWMTACTALPDRTLLPACTVRSLPLVAGSCFLPAFLPLPLDTAYLLTLYNFTCLCDIHLGSSSFLFLERVYISLVVSFTLGVPSAGIHITDRVLMGACRLHSLHLGSTVGSPLVLCYSLF